MNTTEVILPAGRPRYRRPFEQPLSSPNTVRTYRSSPSSVTVQIRTDKGFCNADLPFDVARQFGEAILAAVEDGAKFNTKSA